MDKINRNDNLAAIQALANQGITFVSPNPGETERWRSIADRSISTMVEKGVIAGEIVSQVRQHLNSYRNRQ